MNYYYYYDPETDQYIIKKVNNIEEINKKYFSINNHLIISKKQIKNTIKEAIEEIKTYKNIKVLI